MPANLTTTFVPSRRAVLGSAAITGIALAAQLGPAPLARADENPFSRLRDRWVGLVTGGSGYEPTDPAIAGKLNAINDQAQLFWDSMDRSTSRTQLWSDAASTTVSAHVTTNYSRLRAMALAHRTRGCSLADNPDLVADVVAGMAWMHANRYHENTVIYDNWWDWEIGAPTAIGEVVCLIHPHLTGDQITTWFAPVERHSPDPTKLHGTKEAEGANRVSMAKLVALHGMNVANASKLAAARDALSAAFAWSTGRLDGMYRDGSYLYHTNLPYNGAYGIDSLDKIGELLQLLAGSAWQVTDPNHTNITAWVRDAFQPFMYRGAMMDMVRGRAMSRDYAEDHVVGHGVIESVVQAIDFSDPSSAAEFKRWVKAQVTADTYRDYVADVSIAAIVATRAIMADPQVVAAAEPVRDHQFAIMDRTVVRRSGYAFGISMHSARMRNFEISGGENLAGWHTADGMTYLYNSDLAQYSDDFWPTVDPYRLAGTTVIQGSTSVTRRCSDRVWVGGANLADRCSATGMWLHPHPYDLEAKKSWFAFDDEIVALGSDVTSAHSSPVETIVENRKISNDGTNRFVVNGSVQPSAPGWTDQLNDVDWAHLSGNAPGSDIGYWFPGGADLQCARETRTGTWRAINDRDRSPSDVRTNNFLTIACPHGTAPTARSYAYVLLPGRTAEQTARFANRPRIRIVAQSSRVHAATSADGVTCANFWNDEPTTAAGISVDRRASVVVRTTQDSIEVAVADPTHLNQGIIQVELTQFGVGLASADPAITVTQYAPTIKFAVDVSNTNGRSLRARFTRSGTRGRPATAPQDPQTPDVIVDNTDPGFATDSTNWVSRTSATGSQQGTNFLIDPSPAADSTMWAMWTPFIGQTGRYDVFLKWTADTNRPTAAPVEVAHRGGVDRAPTVNQQRDSGQWVKLGNYELAAGTSNHVKILASAPGTTVADAARFTWTGPS